MAVLDLNGGVVIKVVVGIGQIEHAISDLVEHHEPERIVVGNGTGSEEVIRLAEKLAPGKVSRIHEEGTTLEARELAWRENPPGGLWRILPRLFWPTPRNLDAWAAVVIGRRALKLSSDPSGM